jgi:hypothetical protein
MTSLTVDAATLSRLQDLAKFMEIRDESGRVLGYFHPLGRFTGSQPTVRASPFTDDELRERQKQRTGKPLTEVLAKLSSS